MTKGIANLQAFHDVVMKSKVLEVDALPDTLDKNTFYFHTYQTDSADKKSKIFKKECLYSLYSTDDTTKHFQIDMDANLLSAEAIQKKPAFINYIRENTEPKVLIEVIDAYQNLVETRLPKHYLLMSDERKEAEKIKLRAVILALDAQLSAQKPTTIEEQAQQDHYKNLHAKASLSLSNLQGEKQAIQAIINPKQPKALPSFTVFTKKRLTNWLGWNYFENFDKQSRSEQCRNFLLFFRTLLTNLKSKDLNWAYKQNTAALNAAKAFIEGTGKNPLHHDLEDIEARLEETRESRRHLKNHVGWVILLIDGFLAGMQAYKNKQQDKDLSLYEAFNQLPQKMHTELKVGLLKQIIGNAKFWTKFGLDKSDLELKDISLVPDGMTLKGLMNCIQLLGLMVQFGFQVQGYAETMKERDDKEKEVNDLKIQLKILQAQEKANPSEIMVLKENLKQAEKQLRRLNTDLGSQRDKIMLLVVKISMILLAISFGPAAAWVPIAMKIMEAMLDVIEIVVEHGRELANLYEEKASLEHELADMRLELTTTQHEGDKQLLIKNILTTRNQIQYMGDNIRNTYLSLFRSVIMNLMMSTVRFITMGLLPVDIASMSILPGLKIPGLDVDFAIKAFAKLSEAITVLITDYMLIGNPSEEALPYTLANVSELPLLPKPSVAEGEPEPPDEINFSKMEAGKLYVQRQRDGTVKYWVHGQSADGFSLPKDVLDVVDIDSLTDEAVFDQLKLKLEDILVFTEAQGHTRMLDLLDERDGKEKAANNKEQPVDNKGKRLTKADELLVSDSDDEKHQIR